MTGEVDVRRVLLDPLPPAPVPAGSAVEFSGRAADPAATVTIERDGGAAGFQRVATARPAADGTWKASVPATSTGDYRASVGADASATRRLLVIDRTVLVRATRHGVNVEVVPHLPGAVVVLQLHLRDRFGWWPAQRVRLDYVSRASFKVLGSPLARVALVDTDGWTPGGAQSRGPRRSSAASAQHAAQRAEAPGDAREEHRQEDVRVGQVGLRVLADDLVGDQDGGGGQARRSRRRARARRASRGARSRW